MSKQFGLNIIFIIVGLDSIGTIAVIVIVPTGYYDVYSCIKNIEYVFYFFSQVSIFLSKYLSGSF